MLGMLNQDPPLVDHAVKRIAGKGLDNTDKACGTQSCPVIPQFGNEPIMEELPLSRKLLVPTRKSHEVPLLFREVYIKQGFRATNQPWCYYFLSFFQLHNESMNVWTHFIASFLMAKKFFIFSQHIDFWNDTHSWPLLAGIACGVLLYTSSTLAHWFQSRSELIYYLSFMVDYASIGLYSFSSVILHYTYCADKQVYEHMRDIYLPVGAMLGFLICFCNVVALVLLRREYPHVRKLCQTIPIAFIYTLLISPIVHRIYLCHELEIDCERSIDLHARQIIWFLFSAIFFVSHFPQCVLPGCFDHFFHSHQLFHICITAGTLFQMDAVFEDFFHRENIFRLRPAPTVVDVILPFALIILGEVFSIWTFLRLVRAKLSHEKIKMSDADFNNNDPNNISDPKIHAECS